MITYPFTTELMNSRIGRKVVFVLFTARAWRNAVDADEGLE